MHVNICYITGKVANYVRVCMITMAAYPSCEYCELVSFALAVWIFCLDFGRLWEASSVRQLWDNEWSGTAAAGTTQGLLWWRVWWVHLPLWRGTVHLECSQVEDHFRVRTYWPTLRLLLLRNVSVVNHLGKRSMHVVIRLYKNCGKRPHFGLTFCFFSKCNILHCYMVAWYTNERGVVV